MFESIRNDSKARTLGAIQIEAERRQTMSCHVWTAASMAEKEMFFCIILRLAMKSGCVMTSIKNCGVSLAMHHIGWKAKYPWFEAFALHLVGSADFSLSWSAQTNQNHHGRSVLTTIDGFESSIIWAETWLILKHENTMPCFKTEVKTYLEMLNWEVLPHLPYSPDIAPSNYHLLQLMAHGLAKQHFHSYEDAKKKMGWLMFSLKRYVIFPMWNSNAARKMGKSSG